MPKCGETALENKVKRPVLRKYKPRTAIRIMSFCIAPSNKPLYVQFPSTLKSVATTWLRPQIHSKVSLFLLKCASYRELSGALAVAQSR